MFEGLDRLLELGRLLDGDARELGSPIEMEEVAPGVFAARKDQPPQLGGRLVRELAEAREFKRELERAFEARWPRK